MTNIGVLGASSLVGSCVLSNLVGNHQLVYAFSRLAERYSEPTVEWVDIKEAVTLSEKLKISQWICVAPIWVLVEHVSLLEQCGAKRVVCLSSTSVLTKQDSSCAEDVKTAKRLQAAENDILHWAKTHSVECVILRPTLIYGLGRDKNISEIMRFIRCWGFFPLLGRASGLRQPVHANDVASVCIAALESTVLKCQMYNIPGGETLGYRDMVERLFKAMGQRVCFIHFPLKLFKIAAFLLRIFSRYAHGSSAMAERMNQDLVFDVSAAAADFNYHPRKFRLTSDDLPLNGEK
jgi:nucleoside-diphosphate-sugar epimerase